MKQLTPMLFLLLSISVFAAGNTENNPDNISPGPVPLQLNMAERLWIFCLVFHLSNQAIYDSTDLPKKRIQSASYFKKDSEIKLNGSYSFNELIEQVVKDFLLFDSAGVESLSLQKKADIINAVIGWPGFVAVDSAQHFIWYDYTVPHKVYRKKAMKELSRRYAALAYTWLLRNEDIKKWTMMVHFSKQFKRRIKNLGNRVYIYVGRNWVFGYDTFDEVLAAQLGAVNKL